MWKGRCIPSVHVGHTVVSVERETSDGDCVRMLFVTRTILGDAFRMLKKEVILLTRARFTVDVTCLNHEPLHLQRGSSIAFLIVPLILHHVTFSNCRHRGRSAVSIV